jgi:dipeptidyl aminopeptidase/acylaminoacyl peptidase
MPWMLRWLACAIFVLVGAETPGAPRAANAAENLPRFVPSSEQLTGDMPPRGRAEGRVYQAQLTPHWSPDGTYFWYRKESPGDRREFILIDAVKGIREPAFDHARMAEALQAAGVGDAPAERLPLESLTLHRADHTAEFRTGGKNWRCDLETYTLQEIEKLAPSPNREAAVFSPGDAPRASTRTGAETELTFLNRTSGEVELFWRDTSGGRRSYGRVAAGQERAQHTFAGHMWEVVNAQGQALAVFQAQEEPTTVEITGAAIPPRERRREGRRSPPETRDVSPDGRWSAFLKDHNLWVRSMEDEREVQLSEDGREDFAYGLWQWSPDSQRLAAFRIEPGERKEVHRIESSPRDGGRAKLHSHPYDLPGDKFTSHELNLFHIEDALHLKPEVERLDFGTPRVRWRPDSNTFTYEKMDRGHQRFRLMEIDAHTGAARALIDEQTDTFIWSGHTQNVGVGRITWLEESDEIIYMSERSGWRHLYLVDATSGAIKNPITQGEWVVRGVDRIDETQRQVWFRASGMNAGQDPYLIHYYRVNFDGSELTALTAGDGNHRILFSPEGTYLIDTYSRVDLPPVHELRRTSDGALVCELEKADVSELEATEWTPPEVFSAKGRDGVTDIWGVIYRPRNFDPAKKYPVLEHIYAGPHDSHVPKSFSAAPRFRSLTDLGFFVVQIDGMGTANRSKAFHDVCWKNLKDAGLPDRILWHQAVAQKYPSYDIERVGIYGGSAGGQNSTGAVLFHPEFYKAAVSGCGCHDNRLDKASWNEQWMGYPVGPQYAESSNIENAGRLQGKLLLIVGEMDNNVPPESTLRLADALIRAEKDFDLLVVPGAGHGMGGAYGERRLRDFFVRHLHGVEPPDRNRPRGK